MEVSTLEVEEEEGGMVVTNVSMMNTMLGHIRLPGQEGEEELDLVVEEMGENDQHNGKEPGGSDVLTGVFFSLLAFR